MILTLGVFLTFGVVDVFADHPLSGNPLAVVEGGEQLSDDTLRAIAREFNQSETTFILPPGRPGADWKLRSFTAAGAEVFGAGHNALGAWLWLAERGRLGDLSAPRRFHQQIGDAVLPVRLERRDGRIHGTMVHEPLKLGPVHEAPERLAAALGLAPADLVADPRPRVASTGAAHLLVRVRDRGAVDRAVPDGAALLQALGGTHDRGCYIYAIDATDGTRAYARFFNPSVGLAEDPATGSAAGPLAAYLHHEGRLAGGRLTIEQGTKMGRRSLLAVSVGETIELSGPGVVVMTGELRPQ